MGVQCLLVTACHPPCRPPHVAEARGEVAPRPAALELVAAMFCAQPHRDPVRQEQLRPRPVPPPPTDRTHRVLPERLPLVVRLRHTTIVPPEHVTPLTRTAPIHAPLCANRRNSTSARPEPDDEGTREVTNWQRPAPIERFWSAGRPLPCTARGSYPREVRGATTASAPLKSWRDVVARPEGAARPPLGTENPPSAPRADFADRSSGLRQAKEGRTNPNLYQLAAKAANRKSGGLKPHPVRDAIGSGRCQLGVSWPQLASYAE